MWTRWRLVAAKLTKAQVGYRRVVLQRSGLKQKDRLPYAGLPPVLTAIVFREIGAGDIADLDQRERAELVHSHFAALYWLISSRTKKGKASLENGPFPGLRAVTSCDRRSPTNIIPLAIRAYLSRRPQEMCVGPQPPSSRRL